MSEINKLEDEEDTPYFDLVEKKHRALKDYDELILREEVSWRQKVTFKCFGGGGGGDCNFKLFYKVASGKRRNTFIKESQDIQERLCGAMVLLRTIV